MANMFGLLGPQDDEALGGLLSAKDLQRAKDDRIISLGAGILGGQGNLLNRIGQGVQGAQHGYQSALDGMVKRKYYGSQIAENESQAELRKIQLQMAQQKQAQIAKMLGLDDGGQQGQALPQPDQQPSQQPGQQPGQQPIVTPVPAPGQMDRKAMGYDLMFNEGKNLGTWQHDDNRPKWAYQDGVRVNTNAQPGSPDLPASLPQGDRFGRFTQTMADPSAPGGFRIQVPQGAEDIYKSRLQAEEQAKANNDIVTVKLPNGTTQQMTRAQQLQMMGPQTPQTAPQPTQRPSMGTPGGMQPGMRQPNEAGINGTRDAILQQEYSRAQTAAQSPDPQVAAKAQKDLQALQTEMGGKVPGMQVQSSSDAAAQETTKTGQAKRYVDLEGTFKDAGRTAQSQMQKLQRMQELADGLSGGKYAPMSKEIQSGLASLGFPEGKMVGKAQALEALAAGMAAGFRVPGTGSSSDFDVKGFLAQVPDLSKTPTGRAQIAKTLSGLNQRAMDESTFAQKWISKYGSLNNDFESQLAEWQRSNPIKF